MHSFESGRLVLVDGVVCDWGLAWNEVVGSGLVLMRLFVICDIWLVICHMLLIIFFIRISRVGLLYTGWGYSVVVVIVVLRAHAFMMVADEMMLVDCFLCNWLNLNTNL